MKLNLTIDLLKLTPKLRKRLLAVLNECATEAPTSLDAPPPACGPGEDCKKP